MGLWAFIARRLVLAVLVLFIVSIGTFLLAHAVPGDPISAIIGVISTLSPLGRISTALVNRLPSPAGSTVWVTGGCNPAKSARLTTRSPGSTSTAVNVPSVLPGMA